MFMTGLSAFPLTPSDPEGRVDVGAVRLFVGRIRDAGVSSIGLLGSTGTYPYLARAERRRTLEAALAEVGGKIPVMVGVGALRTDDAVHLAQDARSAGADVGLLAPVSYIPLQDDEVFEHFRTVAEVGLPLCIYDNPDTTRFGFSRALISRLAAIEGIVAVKSRAMSSAEEARSYVVGLRALVPRRFSLGTSGDAQATEAMIAGMDTWYCVLAGLFPRSCLAIVHAVRDGRIDEARRLDARLGPIWRLFQEFSSLRTMYACASELGLCDTPPPLPILPLGVEKRRRVVDVLRHLELE